MTTRSRLTPRQRGILTALTIAVVIAGAALIAITLIEEGTGPEDTATTLATPTTAPPAPTTTPPPATTTTTVADTTTTAVPEPTTTTRQTTTTVPEPESFTIRPDGIDRIYFGADADETIESFIDRLGDPDEDTGWRDNTDGTCVGAEIRFVEWDGLSLFFTSGPSDWARAGVEHFASYTVGPDGEDAVFTTTNGIGIESTVSEVEAAYGDSARIFDHPVYGAIFEVDPPGSGVLIGILTGRDGDDEVRSITGGFSCDE